MYYELFEDVLEDNKNRICMFQIGAFYVIINEQAIYISELLGLNKVILENDIVIIYRIGKTGEFEPYQITEITSNMLREGIKEQLETGIIVDDIEELFLLMEDIES